MTTGHESKEQTASTLAENHCVNTKGSGWPKAVHVLTRRLNEVMPNLLAVGIEVVTRRDGRHRTIAIRKVAKNSDTCVTTVTDEGTTHFTGDDTSGGSEEASLIASHPGPANCPPGKRDDAGDAYDATSRGFLGPMSAQSTEGADDRMGAREKGEG